MLTGSEDGSTFTIDCSFDLRISSPCSDLETFDETPQTGVEDDYSGETKYFTLTPFMVQPAVCDTEGTIEYTCTRVVDFGGTEYPQLCDDWTYPADANGNLGLTANLEDYPSVLPEGAYTFTVTATGLNGQTETG